MNIRRSHISEQTTSSPTERARAGRTAAAPAKHPAEPQLRSALPHQPRPAASQEAVPYGHEDGTGGSRARPSHGSRPSQPPPGAERAHRTGAALPAVRNRTSLLQQSKTFQMPCTNTQSIPEERSFFFFLQSNPIASSSQVLLIQFWGQQL